MKYTDIESNFRSIEIGNILFYISYETTIALEDLGTGDLFISENIWSSTTGNHLNLINDDKSIRIPYNEFKAILNTYETQLGY